MSRMFQNYKAVLIDLSGTLHIDNVAINESPIALAKIRSHGFKIKFVTNTTKESVASLCTRLQNLNFDISKNEIFSSLIASKELLLSHDLRPFLMLSDCAKEDFIDIDTNDPNAVVVGLSPSHFVYDEMTSAFRLLLNGASLIAINKARYFKRSDGLALGAGAFVSALEYASGTKSIVVGKPEGEFFLGAAKALGCSPAECVMIGDDFHDDIEGALKVGMKGILVQTGKYLNGDELKISLPDFCVAKDFTEAVELLLSS